MQPADYDYDMLMSLRCVNDLIKNILLLLLLYYMFYVHSCMGNYD